MQHNKATYAYLNEHRLNHWTVTASIIGKNIQ